MYLIEGRKFLDAHVFNGLQEIAKSIITYVLFPWIFEVFVSFHSYIHTWSQKHTLFNKTSLRSAFSNVPVF